MIYALHGAVGSAEDWANLYIPEETIQHVNLWRFLMCCPKPISEMGTTINSDSTDKKANIIGYSMGGRLALHALLDDPNKWEKAIIISAHTGLINEKEKSNRLSIDAEWASKALSLEWKDFLKEWNQQDILSKCQLPDRMSLKKWQRQIARSFIDWSTGAQEDLLPKLSNISTKVLWLTGEKDKKFTSIAENACKLLPDSKHKIVPNVGHRIPWEKPEVFNQLCSEFLKK